MEQRSPEWYAARKGRITGSNVGAALGINPWKTPKDLIRQMVREFHGAEPEFTGNIATEYGSLHEPLAVFEYFAKTGEQPQECGFFVHPVLEWLGASPDGLLENGGTLEVKCPFGLRNKKGAELVFKTAKEQPHYYAQTQIEMACAQRKWAHFYQWTPNGDNLETVHLDQEWLDENLPKLEEFYNLFLSEIDNPEHLTPKAVDIDSPEAYELLQEYDKLKEEIDNATARTKEIIEQLAKITGGANATLFGRKFTKVVREGSISYAKVVKDHAPDVDLEPYRGKPSEYWKIS